MPIISLPAHFDGKRICLDEPYDLEPDTKQKIMKEIEGAVDMEPDEMASMGMRLDAIEAKMKGVNDVSDVDDIGDLIE